MHITLRPGRAEDAAACGRVGYDAFAQIALQHGFLPDFPTVESAEGAYQMLLTHPGFYSVIAERDGRVAGSCFMDERGPVGGIGPVTVDPAVQNAGMGRQLMEAVLVRADMRRLTGTRLVQSAYHTRSLCLYAKLGFQVREPLVMVQNRPLGDMLTDADVRPAVPDHLAACSALCRRVHGHDRPGEVDDAVQWGHASVVVREGRITGYSTGFGLLGHTVGETSDDVLALLQAGVSPQGAGFLLPSRNGELLGWCLDRGYRVVQLMTLMSRGFYQEPQGAFLPSVLY